MLATMKIKCEYSENGCPEILPYDKYLDHVTSCIYSA